MSRIDLDAPFPGPPPPLPSRSELERLLPQMDNAQKAELLALLEARGRAQAAQPTSPHAAYIVPALIAAAGERAPHMGEVKMASFETIFIVPRP
jgi:hypothetical protein